MGCKNPWGGAYHTVLRMLRHLTHPMLLSIPPRPSSRPRLIPGLSLRSGDLVAGRYRVLSLLRADRACAHFAAMESRSHAQVEVQILLAMDDSIEPVMLRFLADARKAAALRGAHVEHILHVGVTDDGHPFVVREPLPAETLVSVLGKWGSLPTEVSVDIAISICEALESAHGVGLVHGELDAATIRLAYGADGPSNVKVAGLGTSRALAMLPFDRCSLASLALRAPEQLVAESPIDARVDVWSVGVVLYTMLAGAAPFAADTPSTLDLTTEADEPALLAGVPDGLAEVVDGCLSRDPSQRPQTIATLAARLALYGSRPVFEKRSSLLVVDTGRYEAQALEQLVKETASSAPSIEVDMDAPSSPVKGALEATPEPVVVTRSAPPVAMTVAPPKLASSPKASAPSRTGRTAAFAVAACLGLGAVVLTLATQSSSPRTPSASLAAPPPPAAKTEPMPASAAQAAPAASALARPLAIADLPSAPPTAHAKPLAPGAKPRATAPTKGAAEPAPAVDPSVRSASAPIQPQPKASEDDLRRFLDDRR